jgi:hypothetical protein
MKRSTSFMIAMIATLFYFTGSAVAQEAEKKLFNGTDLSEWNFVIQDDAVPAEQIYSVAEGIIQITGTQFGYMYTKEKYGNYILHAEWRWVEAKESNNSGIFLLVETPSNPFPNGIECQLAAGQAGDFILLNGSDLAEYVQNPNEPRPKFPMVYKKNASSEKPAGEWNKADIAVKDGVITVYINDVYQNTGTNKVKTGYICLQSEGAAVQFRNVTLREW